MKNRANRRNLHPGKSNDAMLDRRDFLERNQDDLIRRMRESGITKPVGVVVDVRDFYGRRFAIATGLPEAEIDALIAKHEGKLIPTVSVVLTWEQARKIMPLTSPNATESLNAAWRLCSLTGQALAIAIMEKGNTYALLNLPGSTAESLGIPTPSVERLTQKDRNGALVSDGQHRKSGHWRFPNK